MSRIARTSLEAHQPETRGKQEAEVLACIRRNSGMLGITREELSRCMKIKESSVCGRVNALIKAGLIEEHGHRFTSTGRHAAILRAVPQQQEIK
jgi:Mn-dependent DtxR family transcriptional regulator